MSGDERKRFAEEQSTRLRACTSDLKLPDQQESEKNTCYVKGIIHPEAVGFKAWNLVIHVLVMWSAFWVTLEFAFVSNPSQLVLYLDAAVCLVFLANMGVTFKAAYRCPKSLRLVTNTQQIASRYLRGGFALDLLSSLPCNLIHYWVHGSPALGALGYVLRGLECLRLYRIIHFYHALSVLGRSNRSAYFSIRLFKLVLNIILASHIFAVAYWFLTLLEPDPENTWIGEGIGPDWQEQSVFLQYVAAMWWSIFIITSIGPAYSAVTTAEQIFCCFYALFGMAALAYTLGTLTMLMVKQSSKTMQYHEDMSALKSYAVRTNLPAPLEHQLKQQLRVQLHMQKSDTASFLGNVPHHLRVAVARQLYLPIIENLDGFRNCSRAFLQQLVGEMDVETVMKNDVVTTEGDVATHLYIVLAGRLVREDGPPSAQAVLGSTFLSAGSVFGKTAVMCHVPQPFTVRAVEHSQLLRLAKAAFTTIAKAYPSDSTVLFNALKQNISNPSALTRSASEQAVFQGLDRNTPCWLIATPEEGKVSGWGGGSSSGGRGSRVLLDSIGVEGGDADLVSGACAAASEGRADRLQALMAQYPHLAGAADYNGRTPMHVAAAYGHVACINLLIQQKGVNVNAVDRSGSTPLLESVKNAHAKAAEALQAAGALLMLKDTGATLCRITAAACAAAAAAPSIPTPTPSTTTTTAQNSTATLTPPTASPSPSNRAMANSASGQPGPSASSASPLPSLLTRSQSTREGGLRSALSRSNSTRAGGSASAAGGGGGGTSLDYLLRLLKAGADVNTQDYAGCSALHVACANRSVVVVKLLVSHGADAHLEDVSGNTPHDLAKAAGSMDLLNAVERNSLPPSPTVANMGGRCVMVCIPMPSMGGSQSTSQFEAVNKY